LSHVPGVDAVEAGLLDGLAALVAAQGALNHPCPARAPRMESTVPIRPFRQAREMLFCSIRMSIQAATPYVVEWSDRARSFRVRSSAEFVASNMQRFFEEICDDYGLLGLFDSREDAVRFVEQRISASAVSALFSARDEVMAA
jgi:hypothetical protein